MKYCNSLIDILRSLNPKYIVGPPQKSLYENVGYLIASCRAWVLVTRSSLRFLINCEICQRQQQKNTIAAMIFQGKWVVLWWFPCVFLGWLTRGGFLHQQIKLWALFKFDLPKVTNWLDLFRHFMDSTYTSVGLCFQTDDFWMTSRRGRRWHNDCPNFVDQAGYL